jgi:chromosome segregation ATPase
MESEKVKEIKKALECCSTLMDKNATSEEQDNACNNCPYQVNGRCSWVLDKDALELINELESENEKLAKAGKRATEISKELSSVHKKIEEQLKDRIAELEKENACLTEECQNLNGQLMNTARETAPTEWKLKQFAERLKEEFIKSANIQDSITAKKLFRDICPVKVDKVLKKFIKEK